MVDSRLEVYEKLDLGSLRKLCYLCNRLWPMDVKYFTATLPLMSKSNKTLDISNETPIFSGFREENNLSSFLYKT